MKNLAYIEPEGLLFDEEDQPLEGARAELDRLEQEGWQVCFLSARPADTMYQPLQEKLSRYNFLGKSRSLVLKPAESADIEPHMWKSSYVIRQAEEQGGPGVQVLFIDPQPRNVTALSRKWQQFMGLEGLQVGSSLVE